MTHTSIKDLTCRASDTDKIDNVDNPVNKHPLLYIEPRDGATFIQFAHRTKGNSSKNKTVLILDGLVYII